MYGKLLKYEMKKLKITIVAPDVDILAKVLIDMIEKINDYPDAKIDSIEYQDESTNEKMKQLIAKSISEQNKS